MFGFENSDWKDAKPVARKASQTLRRSPSQARSKATVEIILEATARILAEQGIAHLNTNAIARKAGVSVGSVYEYFPDKRAILDLLIDRHLSEGETALAMAAVGLSTNPQPSEVVAALVCSAIQLHRNDPRLHRVLSSEIPLSTEQQRRVENLRANAIKAIAASLGERVQQPELKATLLYDAADALAHRWIVDDVGSPIAPEDLSRELTTMLTRYIAADVR